MGRFQRASAAAVEKSEKALSFELAVPTSAKRNKKEPRDARWKETVVVNEVTTEETTSQKGDDHLLMIVNTTIVAGPDGSDNEGRTVNFRGRLNYEAYNEGNPKNKQYKMHEMTMANLSALLRAGGLYDGGDLEEELLESTFPEQGVSPLVGQTLLVEVHQKPNDDGRIFPEISAFIVADSGGGATAGVASGYGTEEELSL